MSNDDIHPLSGQIRRRILEVSYRQQTGHVGSCLSVIELLCAVVTELERQDTTRFVLSKGHVSLAYHATLEAYGISCKSELEHFGGNSATVGPHPTHRHPQVEFSTGSLGTGFSFAAGLALGAKIRKKPHQVLTLLSDAECNEGSVWETAMMASHHELKNLTAIIDSNGQQATGKTAEIMNLEPLSGKWEAFNWNVAHVDGHDTLALLRAIREDHLAPRVILAQTVFGRGVSFMEHQLDWHYRRLDERQFKNAMKELRAS